jgi:hypothetical protein
MADPLPGSGLKPVMGDAGLPVVGHLIETFRNGPDFLLGVYRKYGPLHYAKGPGRRAGWADGARRRMSRRRAEAAPRWGCTWR